ncbi:MAG TPA: FAD/NAD(P)-binding oxidoreductase [Thermoanaerobaculia bacterium]
MADRLDAQIAVVGAGPAGIAAATRAAEAGSDVLVIDEAPGPGGQIWKHRRPEHAPRAARKWLERFVRSGARLVRGAQVIAATSDGELRAELPGAGGHMLDVRWGRLILATGARERFLPFPGWTLPNVIGVGAAQALLKAGVSFQGRRVAIAGSGPLLLPAAAALAAGGARVGLVAEQAPFPSVARFAGGLLRQPGKLLQAAMYRGRFAGTRYRTGTWITSARGDDRVREAVYTDGNRSRTVACDVLCCGYGLVPNLDLPMLLGCATSAGKVVVDERQQTSQDSIYCAGELTGIGGVDLALVEGEIAGLAAAGKSHGDRSLPARRSRQAEFAARLEAAFALRDELKSLARPDTIVCRCEDVILARLDPRWRRRQAKLYSRAGMGPCQGRVCGPALEFLFGWESDTVRVPVRPTPLAGLAHKEERADTT